MGLFNRLGREVEQLKQTVTTAAEQDAEYRCESCDASFHVQHEQCPECGAESVVPTTAE